MGNEGGTFMEVPGRDRICSMGSIVCNSMAAVEWEENKGNFEAKTE